MRVWTGKSIVQLGLCALYLFLRTVGVDSMQFLYKIMKLHNIAKPDLPHISFTQEYFDNDKKTFRQGVCKVMDSAFNGKGSGVGLLIKLYSELGDDELWSFPQASSYMWEGKAWLMLSNVM